MIESLVTLILFSFCVACLGLAFQKYQEEGMIFEGYAKWLESLQEKGGFREWISYPLGLCPYCNTTWIFIVLYLTIVLQNSVDILDIIGLFSGIGVTYFWIEIIEKWKA